MLEGLKRGYNKTEDSDITVREEREGMMRRKEQREVKAGRRRASQQGQG